MRSHRIISKMLYIIIFFPFYLIKWIWQWRQARQRRRNYEILGHYVALLGNNPTILGYFRTLIEKGVSEKKLLGLLESNIHKLRDFEHKREKEIVESELEKQQKVKEIAAEQQELLHQAKLSLEQIKFREKLLEGLYQKIQKKYRI